MKKLTILVDVDDVMWDFLGVWLSYLNKMSGRNLSIFDITDWNVGKFYPTVPAQKMFLPLNRKEFWSRVKPMPGAQEYTKKIIEDGHRLVLVTASHPDTVKYKARKLFELFPHITKTDLIIAQDKSLVSGDIMVDDAPHNLENTPCNKVLFSRPHNLSYPAHKAGWTRAKSWEEVYKLIQDAAV